MLGLLKLQYPQSNCIDAKHDVKKTSIYNILIPKFVCTDFVLHECIDVDYSVLYSGVMCTVMCTDMCTVLYNVMCSDMCTVLYTVMCTDMCTVLYTVMCLPHPHLAPNMQELLWSPEVTVIAI